MSHQATQRLEALLAIRGNAAAAHCPKKPEPTRPGG